MNDLDPDVDIAVLFDPNAIVRVKRVPLVGRGVELWQNDRVGHGQSLSRTLFGHSSTLNPCCRNSAITTRSRPKPRQAVCATSPWAWNISNTLPKWSWW